MDFSLIDYMDEDACYAKLVELLHPDGLACPRCGERRRLGVHRRHRDPVLDYQCGDCGRVFNAWTGTALQGTHRRPVADPPDPPRHRPGRRPRRRWPASWAATASTCWSCGTGSRSTPCGGWTATRWATPWSRPTRCTRTPGKKGIPHADPDDPPRRRANRRRGHGTFANDRPPVAGVVGRESGEVRLEVLDHGRRGRAGGGRRRARRLEGTTVNTDEWKGYNGLPAACGGSTRTVDHSGPKSHVGAGRRRRRGARGPLQHAGGAVDGAAELPAAVPGREQVVPGAVRGDLPVGPQHQGSHG